MPDDKPTLLVVERDPSWREHLCQHAGRVGVQVAGAAEVAEGLARVEPQLAVVPASEGDSTMADVLRRVRAGRPELQVVVHARGASARTVREALRLGAADFYDGGAEPPEALVRAIERARDRWVVEVDRKRLLETMRAVGEDLMHISIQQHRRAAEMEEELQGGAEEGYRVLVVDDEDATRALLRMVLRREGLEAIEASSAEAAEQLFDQHAPQMVITDLRMSGRSGLDLIRSIRRRAVWTEFVLMTAFATVQTSVDALDEEVGAYLIKPFEDVVALGKRLRDLVGRHRARLRAGRHLNKFREAHQEFLARYAALQDEIAHLARDDR